MEIDKRIKINSANWVLVLLCLVLSNKVLYCQHTDLVDSLQANILADTGKSYFLPDVNHKNMRWTKGGNKLFTHQLGFAILLDYDVNIQDETSKTQVGEQPTTGDIRSARMMLRGKINFKAPWSYLISVEYKGFDREEDDPAFGLTDLKFVIPLGKTSDLTVGKIKETFAYEMVGDAANLPHQERLLNPFFKSRNTGISLKKYLLKDRMTIAGGWFNDWFSGGSGANTFTTRITGLPKWELEGKHYMHSAVSLRYAEAVDGKVRLKGKNETNVGTDYVDTKSFDANHQLNVGVEQLWSMENFSVLMEYIHNWTHTPGNGTEQFNGYYVTTSYVVSGEQRPYDKRAAYARRIKPTGTHGAWELVGRFGSVNLNNRDIHGGTNNRYTFGLNWWATQYWKAGLFYGISNLDRDNMTGTTNSFQFRIQWIY